MNCSPLASILVAVQTVILLVIAIVLSRTTRDLISTMRDIKIRTLPPPSTEN